MTEQPRRKTAIDDPDYLRRWFQLSGHPFIVFRVADILGMTAEDQGHMIAILAELEPAQVPVAELPAEPAERRRALQRVGHRGYVLVDVEVIGSMAMDAIKGLQVLFGRYQQVRADKFEPSTWEWCRCTLRGSRPAPEDCRHCTGNGKIWTLHEMSELESALAEGQTWEEIDAQGLTG